MRENTDGVDKPPVPDLIGTRDFSVAVQCMHAGIAWDLNFMWMTGENDCHAVPDIITIFANSGLADMNSYGHVSRRSIGWIEGMKQSLC